jgi:hypothetical protein
VLVLRRVPPERPRVSPVTAPASPHCSAGVLGMTVDQIPSFILAIGFTAWFLIAGQPLARFRCEKGDRREA